MTACVNSNQKREGARRAVGATLAGVLAVGMVPAAALAEEAAEGSDDEISSLAANDVSAAQDGSIVAFKDGKEAGATFTANGKRQGLEPTKVQPYGTTAASAQLDVTGYVVYKLVDAKDPNAMLSTESSDLSTKARTIDDKAFYYDSSYGKDAGKAYALPTEIGEYAVFAKVTAANKAENVVVKAGATFSVEAAELADAELYQINAKDVADLSDTDFTFNAGEWVLTEQAQSTYPNMGSVNRLALKVGDDALDMTQFTYEYYTAKGAVIGGTDEAVREIVAAGDYYVIVSGDPDSPYAGQKRRFDFTVAPYDLATANVVAEDVALADQDGDKTSEVVSIDGTEFVGSWIERYVTVDYPNVATKLGAASLTVNVNEQVLKAAGYAGSIVNSKDVSYNVVEYLVKPTATYGTQEFSSVQDFTVDFSATPTNAFDASKVSVSYTDPKTGKTVTTDEYDLIVTNTATQEVGGAEMLSKSGTYTVVAALDSEALNWAVAGKSNAMSVTVTKGTIAVTDIAFAYQGKEIVNPQKLGEYTPGKDLLKDITVTVKTANGVVDPSDYKVVVTKKSGSKWVEVDAIEDAGNYKVTVVAEGYNVTGHEDSVEVNVGKRDLSQVTLRAKGTFNYTENGTDHRVLPYTGDVITPSYEWSCDGGKTWYDLPADDYAATYTQDGKEVELKKVGDYEASIAAGKKSNNYTGAGTTRPEVSDKKVFADVPNDVWYSQVVYDAADMDYMKGYSGQSLFGPNDPITRGMVACVLFNMAGGDAVYAEQDFAYSETNGFETGFSDVNGKAYYAKAIAWAANAGVVNGYGDGTFAPDANITREEMAAMIANYAKAMGDDMTVDAAAVLAEFPDGGAVSSWATEVVAWAADNGVMGNGGVLNPGSTITRAEVAAMAVNYQPDGCPDVIIKK